MLIGLVWGVPWSAFDWQGESPCLGPSDPKEQGLFSLKTDLWRPMRMRLLLLFWAALLGIAVAALDQTRRPGRDLLARIRYTGVLRVGSTGDYAPFSVLEARGDL